MPDIRRTPKPGQQLGDDGPEQETFDLRLSKVKKITDKAILAVTWEGRQFWIPSSQIKNQHTINGQLWIEVTLWWAKQARLT